MAKVSQMQGVPAHLETLRKKDERRHPAHCKHAYGTGKNRICMCTMSSNYNLQCSSAKHCIYYEKK